MRADHPLRTIREIANAALSALSGEFETIYAAGVACPSIPPERLLRALLLQAFYGVRSERQIMERLETQASEAAFSAYVEGLIEVVGLNRPGFAAAGGALRPDGMARAQGRAGLPRGGGGALLLGPLPPCPHPGGGVLHCAHRGGVRLRRPDRCAPSRQRRRQAHHLVPTTCRPAIAATATGPSSGSCARRAPSAPPPRCSARWSWRSGLTRSRASGRAWAWCVWSGRSARPVSRPPAAAPWEVGAKTYGSVKSILDNHLDSQSPTGARKIRRDDEARPPTAARQHPWISLLPLRR